LRLREVRTSTPIPAPAAVPTLHGSGRSEERTTAMRNRPLISAIVLVVGLAAMGVTWFLGRDSVDVVDIDRALGDAVAAQPDSSTSADGSAGQGEVEDATGTWVVDPEFVAFDLQSSAGTWVGYRIQEELRGIGDFTAVGRSPRVDGEVVIDGGQVVSAAIRADLQGLVSDNANRDSRVAPLFADGPVEFVLNGPVDFGAVPSGGERVTVPAPGVLRIAGVSRDVEFALIADVAGSRLLITGSTVITLADFDVSVPSAGPVLSVSDDATIEFQLFLARG